MWLNIILAAVLFACVAFMVNSGLWSNALTLVNTVMAALVASSFWEPLANWLDRQIPTYTFANDFLALWLLFIVSMVVMRAATDLISRVKVRFKKPVDQAGGIVFALWTGWMMVCFTTFTLHTAPLAQTHLGGAFAPDPQTKMFLGFGPDRLWLGFLHKQSLGALGRGNEFDPKGEFLFKYADRRKAFEANTAGLRANVK